MVDFPENGSPWSSIAGPSATIPGEQPPEHAGKARHEVLVLVDSVYRVNRDYLTAVVSELAAEGTGLVTCLYRAGKASNLAAKIEAIGITAEFAPGVLVAWLVEGISFALGATIATTRANLQAVGGFQAVADYLADDFMLGLLMHQGRLRGPAIIPGGRAHPAANHLQEHDETPASLARGIGPVVPGAIGERS